MKTSVILVVLLLPRLLIAEDFMWEGKKYINVHVEDVDKENNVAIATKEGTLNVPYKRLSWQLKKQADAIIKAKEAELAAAEAEKAELMKRKRAPSDAEEPEEEAVDYLGRRYIHGVVFSVFEEGIVVNAKSDMDGLPDECAPLVRGKVFVSNHPDYDSLVDGDPVSIEVWSVGRMIVHGKNYRKYAFKGYDVNPPVLVEEREWSDYKGRKLTASVAAYEDGKVAFVKGDRVITLPIQKVSMVDRKFIEMKIEERGKAKKSTTVGKPKSEDETEDDAFSEPKEAKEDGGGEEESEEKKQA